VILSWVIGKGGLLGGALTATLEEDQNVKLFDPGIVFNWRNTQFLSMQFEFALSQFHEEERKYTNWIIYWAAGSCTLSSTIEEVSNEKNILTKFIYSLKNIFEDSLCRGSFIFSSSAGAIYGGTSTPYITELTTPSPITPYGLSKLAQEQILNELIIGDHGISILIARISTIYGINQREGKNQGLISTIIKNILLNKPIHIFVPLDTMRDYIYDKDAAKKIIYAANITHNSHSLNLKIIASEKSMSISQILSICKRVTKKNPRIVTSLNKNSLAYKKLIHFSSINPPEDAKNFSNTNPYIGIDAIKREEIHRIQFHSSPFSNF